MDVDKGDDSWSLKEMVSKTHTAVKKLTDRNAERFVGRYDELCVLKTGIDELERGGGRAHDLFLLRLFVTVFSGPASPWRAHNGQPYRYYNGAYAQTQALNIQQALRFESAINKADQTLMRMSKDRDAPRPAWDEAWLLADAGPQVAGAEIDDAPCESFSISRKLLRESLTKFLVGNGHQALRTFCKWCDESKNPRPLLAFKDKCVELRPGRESQVIKKSPDNDCYAYMDRSIAYKPPAADIDRYDLMMATLYGEDTESKEIECVGEALALMHKRQPPRVRVRKGKGGHGARTGHLWPE